MNNIYTSVACNRTTESADWGRNGLIVFGACNAVGIFDPKYDGNSAKILHTYVQHTKHVNTVQWLRDDNSAPTNDESYFLSGADDGLAILWHIDNPKEPQHFLLKGHESGVNAVAGVRRRGIDGWLLATAAADSTLKLWQFDRTSNACECFQTIHLKNGFCFSLRLTQLPKSNQILLAFSMDDETVALWAEYETKVTDVKDNTNNQQQFQLVHKLVGHEDWIRGLDFVVEDNDLLLASSSQDNFIRLWRIAPRTEQQVRENDLDILQELENMAGDIRVEEKILQLGVNAWFAVSLESVLYGHEGWVYGVQWHKSEEHGLRLLSASIDKTLIIWAPTEDGIWMERVRVGEVGGNSLGFFGGKFSHDGKSIFGHSYQGGFHIWHQSEENEHLWKPNVIVGGHFGEVRDLAWDPQGAYLMSVSADQTTRIHAPWQRATSKSNEVTWHELARPQVHGYDMQALAVLSRYKFASGAEEKIVRTFQTSANFIENFRAITHVQRDAEGDALLEKLPKGASVPSLGLSNKAVYDVDVAEPMLPKHVKDEYPENYFVPVRLEMPPQEETLMQNTLWPEVQKLYGHGFEIYALAATSDGRLLASSCRATNAEHAQIILWNTTTWKQIQKLSSHQLTVTQMRFSPDGRRLLSVSRDRRWSLFELNEETSTDIAPTFALTAFSDKMNAIHTRIIWSCDWSHDGQLFVTSSRDGKVVIWKKQDTTEKSSLIEWRSLEVLELKNESVTAVAFATKCRSSGAYIVAVGCESGIVRIYEYDAKWSQLLYLNQSQSHHLTVKRLQFRPTVAADAAVPNQFYLASCGDDHLVRIYEFVL